MTKSKRKWAALALLVLLIPVGIWSNLFAYEYYYFKCEGQPLELDDKYYRVAGDDGYGIRPGSDYSKCSYDRPADRQRDPSTKVGAALVKRQADEAARLQRLATEHEIYVPTWYKISDIYTTDRGDDGLQTTFSITTSTNHKFEVREMKKESAFSYTDLCSKPATANWSGTVIGRDSKGREVCRTNLSKYIKDYIVGISIGKTAIMLQTPLQQTPATSVEVLNAEAIAIFSAMDSYSH
jgi:hypothetical protein